MAALAAASAEVEKALAKRYIVIADRYYSSQAAYTSIMKVPQVPAQLQNEIAEEHFYRRPDVVFYVDGQLFGKDFLTEKQRLLVRQGFLKYLDTGYIRLNNRMGAAEVHKTVLFELFVKMGEKNGTTKSR
jgi:thymidylate kinase